MPDPTPVILYSPSLTISGTELQCLLSHVELVPTVTTVELVTGCGTREYPGSVKWSLHASLYHSFDTEGTNEVLTAAVSGKVPVPFTLIPSLADPVSATNPEYSGEVIPQPFAPISGDMGAESSVDIEWSIVGWGLVPNMSITPLPLTAGTEAAATEAVPEPVATT